LENPLASPAIYAGGGFTSDNLDFSPFSYGLRNCIGMNMALMELRMAICTLVRTFKFELADKELLDEKVAVQLAFTLRPKDKLPMIISMREKYT
jgi:cytochrome P450